MTIGSKSLDQQGRTKLRVLLAECSNMGCELLASALSRYEDQFEVVSSNCEPQQLVADAARYRPDVVLLAATPKQSGTDTISALKEIRKRGLNVSPILLADKRSPQLTVEAFRSGARGMFYREGSFEQLQKCIRVVSAGQIWADNEDMQALLDGLQGTVRVQPTDAKGNELLTDRQKQLVSLMIEGLKNREIAARLNISEHTVRNYLFRIFDKLGVSTRTELIVYAIKNSQQLF